MTPAASSPPPNQDSSAEMARCIKTLAGLLPAQGPLSVFVHHNTLHAFEGKRFEDAVVEAGRLFGCEPFLTEEAYRTEIARGRITEEDARAAVAEDLGAHRDRRVLGITLPELRFRLVLHGIPDLRGHALDWTLHELDALERIRADAPAPSRAALSLEPDDPDGEARLLRSLWEACLRAVDCAPAGPVATPLPPRRHRDLLLRVLEVDVDEWVHPLLIRFTAAYLDQGQAHWALQGRARGMYSAFLGTYGRGAARLSGGWTRGLPEIIHEEARAARAPLESIAESLTRLGVGADERVPFLLDTALALRGWAGMVRQFEERPDRVPVRPVPARLEEFLAVRLLLERTALEHALRDASLVGVGLENLRNRLRDRLPATPAATVPERAWPLFQLAQLFGLDPEFIQGLPPEDVASVEAELAAFDGTARRRVLHLAYERHLRHRFLDALVQHEPSVGRRASSFQAIFCIDEREESFRRHLEEVEPSVETLGTAGFFGIAMYYRGPNDAHPRTQCPVAVRPEHFVSAVTAPSVGRAAALEDWLRGALGMVNRNVHLGSRTLARGALIMALIGTLALIPLVLRVVFPSFRRSVTRRWLLETSEPTKLLVEREEGSPPMGSWLGFSTEEQARIVREQLSAIGLEGRLAPLLFVLGHGSVSLNNPHESAHDCGACSGARGGVNARAFAQMANDPAVRATLGSQGFVVPEETWFVGAERNTSNNAVTFFDVSRVPEGHRASFERARALFDAARRREAEERVRRFEVAGHPPGGLGPRAALRHVEARASDLAEPRPEYGHATNAFCVVGRRARTRGLFLDRRAFLMSYDPSTDPDGAVLSKTLDAVVPVVAGIALEYYFGYVDPAGYGCGTKLPHNVTGLLGVMDGAQSDLRTGLPWQMVEIHEPVRLTLVVESPRDRLLEVIRSSPHLADLVQRRWIFVASLKPDEGMLWNLDADELAMKLYEPERPLCRTAGPSASWFRGKSGHVGFAAIGGDVREARA